MFSKFWFKRDYLARLLEYFSEVYYELPSNSNLTISISFLDGRVGTMEGLDGKFYLVKNQKGKVEKMKKGNVKYLLTKAGTKCGLKQEQVPRECLADYIRNNL